MLIRITQGTAEAFENMVPGEILYPLDKKGHYCIGAVSEEESGTTSQGLLVFEINEEDDTIYAQLSWLYVAQAFRRQGIAEELMTEFYRLLNGEEITDVFCEVPFPEEYNELCAYLEEWGFGFRLTDDYTFITTLGQAAQVPALKDKNPGKEVRPLQELNDMEWKNIVGYLTQQDSYKDMEVQRDAYEQTVSCAVFQGADLEGIFLVQLNGGGQLVPTIMSCVQGSSSAVIYQMLLYALGAALEQYGEQKEVRVDCTTARQANLIAYLFPDAQPALVRSGRYVWNEEEE